MTDTIDQVARAQITGHIDVCTERYGNIWTALGEIKAAQNTTTKWMFTILASTCGASVVGLCAVVFYLLTGHHA